MNFYQKIVNNGVSKLVTEKEKRLGRITNILLLVMFLVISIAGTVIVASGINSVILYNIGLILILIITGFIINKAGYFTVTKTIFLLGFNLIALFVSLKINWKGFVPFTSMLFLLVPVLVFGEKEKIWRYIMIVIPVLCYVFLIYTDYDVSFIEKEQLDPEKVKIIQTNNILVIVFTIVLLVYTFITTIEKSEKELENTISELEEKNKVIQYQNEELQATEEELQQNIEELQTTQDNLLKIQAEQQNFVRLIEHVDSFIAITDLEGKLQYLNQTGKAMSGLEENYKGKFISEFHNEESAKEIIIPTLMQKGEWKGEHQLQNHVTKEIFNTLANVFLLKDPYTKKPISRAIVQTDITERKKREEYNQLLQTLINNTSDAVQVSDTEGKFVYMNEVGLNRLGMLGEDITKYTTADIESMFKEEGVWQKHIEEVKAVDTFIVKSTNVNKTTGIKFPVEVAIKYTELNGRGFMVAISRDVTKQHKREQEVNYQNEKLLVSEEQLKQNIEELQTTKKELERQSAYQKAILDNAALMVIATDTNGIITSFNPAAENTLGYSAQKIIGIESPALFHDIHEISKRAEELHQEFNEEVKVGFDVFIYKTLKGLPNIYEWTYIKKNKEKITINLTISAILQNKEIIGYLGIAEDITERKKTERIIKKQNEILKISEKEIRQSYQKLQTTQQQLIQSEKMASLGQLVASIAHEINTPLGAIRSSADSIETILIKTLPSLPSFIKKLDTKTIFIFNEFLQKSIQKTDTLSSKEKRKIRYNLEEQLEAMEAENADYYANVVVDMNMYDEKEIFMGIFNLNHSKELKKEFFDTAYNLSTIIKSNQTIKIATERAAKTVFALKSFTHQDHNTQEKKNVNLNETLEITLTLYHNQIKQGINLIRHFGEIPPFLGYPDELVQVWTNLIHNAIQAMNAKGKLIISTKNQETQNQIKTVLISIQDTGTGIPKEIQEKIFDAFFTTKPMGEGSGLGLDITKKIIEKHNGKIWFESEEGIGTTFFVELPIH